jgi:hypothetical protein
LARRPGSDCAGSSCPLMLNCFLPSCSCIALKPLRPSRIGQRVRSHAICLHRNTRRGNCGWFDSVLRDTPHARVSVSYVLEASRLLNDRFQTEVRWEMEANRTRASLGVKYTTGVNGYFFSVQSLRSLCLCG